MPTPDPDDAVRVPNSPLYVKHVPEHLKPALLAHYPAPAPHHVTYEAELKKPAPIGEAIIVRVPPYRVEPARQRVDPDEARRLHDEVELSKLRVDDARTARPRVRVDPDTARRLHEDVESAKQRVAQARQSAA
jgi:hypothetical protein